MKKIGALFCLLLALSSVGCDLFGSKSTEPDDGADPPAAPVLASPTYASSAVTLTWTCGDTTVDGFVIGRSAGTWNDNYATVVGGSVHTWTDTGTLTPGSSYSYRAVAKRGTESSGLSNTVSVSIPLPDYTITYKVTGTASASLVTINYSDSSANWTAITPSALPWEQSVISNVSGYGYGLTVGCPSVTTASVTLTGEIWMDGVKVQEQTASSTSLGMGIYFPPSINLSYMTP